MKAALITSLLISILSTAIITTTGYGLVRDVDALVDRTQVAADREDMTEYVTELQQNMEHHGMAHGLSQSGFGRASSCIARKSCRSCDDLKPLRGIHTT